MTAYRRVYDSRHMHANCQEPGSAPEPCARQSSMGYFYLSNSTVCYCSSLALLMYYYASVVSLCFRWT